MVQRELQSLRIQTVLCTLSTEHTVLHSLQEEKSSFQKRPVTLTKMYCLYRMNVCIAWMSATPLKHRTYNESCSYTGGNILFYFSYEAWFCSALYQHKAGVAPLKSLMLKRHFQNQSCKAFLQKKKVLTAKPASPPVQLPFSKNHSCHLGLNIFVDD